MFLVFELVFLSIVACTSAGGKQSFDGGNYVVEWMHLPETKEIEFNITVKTTGWVGLGISEVNGDMKKLDVAVGGLVNDSSYLWDMYADGKARPVKDAEQDAKLLSGSEANGTTMIRFKRKLDTGHAKDDVVIKANELYYLAMAYRDKDDAADPMTFIRHSKRAYSNAVTLYTETTTGASAFSPAVLLLAVAAAAVHALNYM